MLCVEVATPVQLAAQMHAGKYKGPITAPTAGGAADAAQKRS